MTERHFGFDDIHFGQIISKEFSDVSVFDSSEMARALRAGFERTWEETGLARQLFDSLAEVDDEGYQLAVMADEATVCLYTSHESFGLCLRSRLWVDDVRYQDVIFEMPVAGGGEVGDDRLTVDQVATVEDQYTLVIELQSCGLIDDDADIILSL